jgi:PAS domain-containing protein
MVLSTMRLGAHDYLLKDNLVRLAPMVERELRDAERQRTRRRAESDLVDRDARWRAILDNLPDALLTIDDGGRIELFNRAAEEMFGYAAGEVQGAQASELFAGEGDLQPGLTRARRRDGSAVWVEVAVGAARPDPQPLRIVRLQPATARESS